MANELETWVRRISEQEIPIFKYTATAISKSVESDDTSTAQLAQIILRDTSLTAKILRLSNSVLYNPGSTPISTISRAILYLGFDMVRGISMSMAVIDAILKSRSREYVKKLMAKSFHGATLAREMANKRGDDATEEVFIAALLYNIGEMAFWCIAEDKGEEILSLVNEQGYSPVNAQKEILGFSFDQLTVGLTRDWHMCDLLHSTINNPKLGNPRIQEIHLSKELANSATLNWDNAKCEDAIHQIASYLDIKDSQARTLVRENAEEVAEIARQYGAAEIINYLPIPHKNIQFDADELNIVDKYPKPDPLLQLNILKDLSSTLETKPTPNMILEIILEGLHRGIGLDRCVFALLTPDKTLLKSKFSVGQNTEILDSKFQFDMRINHIFSNAIKTGLPAWVKNTHKGQYAELIDENMRRIFTTEAFFVYPLSLNRKPIGLFYADRQPSQRALDVEMYSSFKHFAQQACMAMEHITPRK
ncbi:MAG: HDOD domain-containing protein [Gammaproteobacteria bacterium]|nr:HDOD domain-containing protein [Gammaproteobacteria bacterium]